MSSPFLRQQSEETSLLELQDDETIKKEEPSRKRKLHNFSQLKEYIKSMEYPWNQVAFV